MRKTVLAVTIIFFIAASLFPVGITLQNAFEPTMTEILLGVGIRAMGLNLVGFELVILTPARSLRAGRLTDLQFMPFFYLNIPLENPLKTFSIYFNGDLSTYFGVAPAITREERRWDIKLDLLYLRGGLQYIHEIVETPYLSSYAFFVSSTILISSRPIYIFRSIGIESGVCINF